MSNERPAPSLNYPFACKRCHGGIARAEQLPLCRFCVDEDVAAALSSPSVTYAAPDEGPALRALAAQRGDVIDRPNHYVKNGIEVVLVCEAFLPGEVILTKVAEYLLRAPHKGSRLEDLRKAQRWLGRQIALEEGRAGSWE